MVVHVLVLAYVAVPVVGVELDVLQQFVHLLAQTVVVVPVLACVVVLVVGVELVVQSVCLSKNEINIKIESRSMFYLASCSPGCSNGGICSSPNSCTCPTYWTGTRCTTRN